MPTRTSSGAARRHGGGSSSARRAAHSARDESRTRAEEEPSRAASQSTSCTSSSASATYSSDDDAAPSKGGSNAGSESSFASSASEYDVEDEATDDDTGDGASGSSANADGTSARRSGRGEQTRTPHARRGDTTLFASKPHTTAQKTPRAGLNSPTATPRQHKSDKSRSGGDGRTRAGHRSSPAMTRKRGRPPKCPSPHEVSGARTAEFAGSVADVLLMTPHGVHDSGEAEQHAGSIAASAVRYEGGSDGPHAIRATGATAAAQATAGGEVRSAVPVSEAMAGWTGRRRRIESLEQCLAPATSPPTSSSSYLVHRFVPDDGGDEAEVDSADVAAADEATAPSSWLTRTVDEAVARTAATSLSPLPAALNAAVMESRALQQQGRSPSFLLSHPHAYLATPHFSLYASAASLVLPRRPGPSHIAEHLRPAVRECGVVVPVVVGSCVRLINPDKREKSHQWTVYVRGLHNGHPRCTDDTSLDAGAAQLGGRRPCVPEAEADYLSHFVEKVVFVLDRSFTPYVRTVTQAPFELTEVGWGEFVVMMYVYLKYDGRQASSQARRVRHRLQHYVYEGNATGNNTGGSNGGNGTANVEGGNVYVDTMLEINHNDAARALFYRGPLLPPYLVTYSSEEDSESDESDGGSEATTTTLDSARSQQADGDVAADSPTQATATPRRRTRSPAEDAEAKGDDADHAHGSSPRARPTGCDAPSVKREPGGRGVKLEPGVVEAGEGVGRRPHAVALRRAAPGLAAGGNEAVGSVVMLSHLLRFSHRAKLPLGIPPVGDVRAQDRAAELAGYVHVSEPVVTERYDELVLPMPCLPAADDDNSGDASSESVHKTEVKQEGERRSVVGVKEEEAETGTKATASLLGGARTARDRAAALLAAAQRMESQLRDCLRHCCRDGAKAAAAACPAYSTTTMRGGVSCWPTVVSHGDAIERDMACTAAYLRSTVATAHTEGWLAAVLEAGRAALTSDATRAGRRCGDDWPCIPSLTLPEYDVMGALLALPELDGRAAFTEVLMAHAVEFGALVLAALQAKSTAATPSFALYSEPRERGVATVASSKSSRSATHHPHAPQGNFANGDKKRLFGHVADLEMLTQLRTGLQESIYAMRAEATRRQAAQTLRDL